MVESKCYGKLIIFEFLKFREIDLLDSIHIYSETLINESPKREVDTWRV